MKIFTILILCLNLSLILCGCDINSGKRPYDYENSVWISSEPDSKFYIASNNVNPYGYIKFESKKVHIILVFDHGNRVAICKKSNIYKYEYSFQDALFIGICKFYPNKLIVKVDRDFVFNGLYDEIIFVKEDIESDIK